MSEVLQENCFEACGDKAELPFLSVQEGLCFRNCITKFSVFYPTLRRNLIYTEHQSIEEKAIEQAAKKYQSVKNALTDPWEKERDNLLKDFVQRKPAF